MNLSHIASTKFEPINLFHCALKYQPKGMGRDQIIGEFGIPSWLMVEEVRLTMIIPIRQDLASGPSSLLLNSVGLMVTLPLLASLSLRVLM